MNCKVCGEKGLSRELCGKHYQRFMKHGDPQILYDKEGNLWRESRSGLTRRLVRVSSNGRFRG